MLQRLIAALLVAAWGLPAFAVQAGFPARAQDTIVTQNLVAAGTATPGSCVAIDARGVGGAAVGVTGVFTGALSGQVTVDNTTWTTMAPTPFAPYTALGTPTATIGSGATGSWQVSAIAGAAQFRVCGLGAMTGGAIVSIQAIEGSASSGGSSSGGGAITAASGAFASGALASGSVASGAMVDVGAQADAAAAADNSTASLIALIKRVAQNLTTVNTSVNTTFAVSTATLANVSASATSVTCLASNASRKGAIFVNDSASATAYFKYGATASTTSYTFQVLPGGTLTLPNSPVYTGIVDCIWSAASGSARVTEE